MGSIINRVQRASVCQVLGMKKVTIENLVIEKVVEQERIDDQGQCSRC